MPDNKDFLDQFSDAGKPASFKEEERVPVKKEKKPLNVKALIIAGVVLLLAIIASYFLFFAPKIEMPNFVGLNKNDIAAWVKQQGIEATGVVFSEEYDFDTSEGTVLTQSIPAGKKVKNNVKLNFTLSKGADPDERISVPDLESMEKEDIQAWIADNKLQKTKISTGYNENVAENKVIDYSFSGCEEDSFTRGCSLKINISKGSAPAGKVTVEDFVKKSFEQAETWAKSKKVNVAKTEQYSDQIDKGLIISQSVSAGKTMNEGETLNVVVSLGKAIYMPNMIGWSPDKLASWQRNNSSIGVTIEEDYSTETKGIVINQTTPAGTLLKDTDYIKIYTSKGDVVEFGDCSNSPYSTLIEKINKANIESASISEITTHENHDTIPAGIIIYNDAKVRVGGTVNITVSKGKNILLKDKDITWDQLVTKPNALTEEQVRALCDFNEVTYKIKYVKSEEPHPNGTVLKAYRSDNKDLMAETYCSQDVLITIEVYDESR